MNNAICTSKLCPKCRQRDTTDFSTCRYCGTRYDFVPAKRRTAGSAGGGGGIGELLRSWPGFILVLVVLIYFVKPILRGAEYVAIGLTLGDCQKTIRQSTETLKRDPADYSALVKRAQAYAVVFRCADAINDYTRAIALRPTDKGLYLKRAELYDGIGDGVSAAKDRSTAERLGR